ncbi:MAG: glycosyltransferase family 9 protein [Deltaproteobacteria bacterium]|nr:glycosyltransferase family 9 protein [Deltaproteobacteria bacterium]MBW2019470.1 glycosyltransferase family 9 protein [Deltaproteobacteria bacterium]MBW2074307.1 glycosyltransferase family 9 protein [Deltaproteobacteria bacterium]RLB82161.1 MAG: hypothetical protein DRH17_06885 [Deltaproteobacteria bacterium]
MREKILVIHQGALGDLVLSFPALLFLKQEEQASVAILCSNGVGKIAHELNIVDAHFPLESAHFCSLFSEEMTKGVKHFISHYDTILLISFATFIEDHLRQNHNGQIYKITPRPPVEMETHVALYMVRQFEAKGLLKNTSDSALLSCLSEGCGVGDAGCKIRTPDFFSIRKHVIKNPKFKTEEEVLLSSDRLVEQMQSHRGKGLWVIHPGAGSQRKQWPLEYFIRVAATIQEANIGEVAFILGPAESDLAPLIKTRSKGGFRVYEVDDLSSVVALVRQARCFIGNDSGVTHLAAFIGTPTVAIFGPSNPKRWSPVGRVTKVLRGRADCVPCFEIAAVNCKDPQCLYGVSVDMVLDAVRELV